MNFLHKLYFFDPSKTVKSEIFIPSDAIDFFTWHKVKESTNDGTRIQLNTPSGMYKKTEKAEVFSIDFISQMIDGAPENVNQIAFDGLFFKCTVQYLSGAEVKKYTSWINPDNISCLYGFLPETTEVFFYSGNRIVVSNNQKDFMKNLVEHNNKLKERRKMKYGKTK